MTYQLLLYVLKDAVEGLIKPEYWRYGVGLIAIKSEGLFEKIRLNPGQYYYLNPTDTAYYMALTNEESLYDFRRGLNAQRQKANLAAAIANIGKFLDLCTMPS